MEVLDAEVVHVELLEEDERLVDAELVVGVAGDAELERHLLALLRGAAGLAGTSGLAAGGEHGERTEADE